MTDEWAAACTDCDWFDTYDTGTEARDAKLHHARDTGHGGVLHGLRQTVRNHRDRNQGGDDA